MAVIAALKLDDVLALGESPGHADGGHGGFGPGADKTHFGDRGKGLNNFLRQLGLGWRTGAEACTVAVGILHGFDDRGVSMAQDQRPPRAYVVDVLVAVDVPNPRAFSPHDVGR